MSSSCPVSVETPDRVSSDTASGSIKAIGSVVSAAP